MTRRKLERFLARSSGDFMLPGAPALVEPEVKFRLADRPPELIEPEAAAALAEALQRGLDEMDDDERAD